MPDITFQAAINVSKDYLVDGVSASGVTANMTNVGMNSLTFALSSSATSITTANLTSVGLAFFRNLSTATASTCTIGIEAGGSFTGFCTLRAGEPALLRLTAGTDYKAVGTAGTRLRVDITEG